jgi:hypothetical protein
MTYENELLLQIEGHDAGCGTVARVKGWLCRQGLNHVLGVRYGGFGLNRVNRPRRRPLEPNDVQMAQGECLTAGSGLGVGARAGRWELCHCSGLSE